MNPIRAHLEQRPFPADDGWGWLYSLFHQCAPPGSPLRHLLGAYFWPKNFERFGRGRLYRMLGAARFGRVIPTGGVTIRRVTGAEMKPYTLRGTSVGAAVDFYYRACAFEAAHLPFLIALLVITGLQIASGRIDLAIEDMTVNLVVNIYPIMHHRHTRVRIVRLSPKVIDERRTSTVMVP